MCKCVWFCFVYWFPAHVYVTMTSEKLLEDEWKVTNNNKTNCWKHTIQVCWCFLFFLIILDVFLSSSAEHKTWLKLAHIDAY